MFKIEVSRKIDESQKTRQKIDTIDVIFGYRCFSYSCDCSSKCKYSRSSKIQNLITKIVRFFRDNLHIKFFKKIFILNKWTNLSGTTTCPFKKPRRYSCSECEYQAGYDEYMKGICGNKERFRLIEEGRYSEIICVEEPRCKLFKKDKFADNYDKNTGEMIFDNMEE